VFNLFCVRYTCGRNIVGVSSVCLCTVKVVVNRTIPFHDDSATGRASSGHLLALLYHRDGLLLYVAVAVAAGCCLLVTAPLALRRRRRQRRRGKADGGFAPASDAALVGSPPPPPPPPPPQSTDVATVRAAVSPYKRNGVVPASQSLRCLTDDCDVRSTNSLSLSLSLCMCITGVTCNEKIISLL